jgi:hypothetical protein
MNSGMYMAINLQTLVDHHRSMLMTLVMVQIKYKKLLEQGVKWIEKAKNKAERY